MKPRPPTNHIDAENRALHKGRTVGYRATIVVHCLDGRGTEGLVSVQTFYPHAGSGDEWLLAALRILADEARARGLIGTAPVLAPPEVFDPDEAELEATTLQAAAPTLVRPSCSVPTCMKAAKFGHVVCRDCWQASPNLARIEYRRVWKAYEAAIRAGEEHDIFTAWSAFERAKEHLINAARAAARGVAA